MNTRIIPIGEKEAHELRQAGGTKFYWDVTEEDRKNNTFTVIIDMLLPIDNTTKTRAMLPNQS